MTERSSIENISFGDVKEAYRNTPSDSLGFAAALATGATIGLVGSLGVLDKTGLSGHLHQEDYDTVHQLKGDVNLLEQVEARSILPTVTDTQIDKQIDHKEAKIAQVEAKTPPGLPNEAQVGIVGGAVLLGTVAAYAVRAQWRKHISRRSANQATTQSSA